MGLTTTHGCWNGTYGTFNLWRQKVARAVGWSVYPMPPGFFTWDIPGVDVFRLSSDEMNGRWGRLPEDPLVVLMAHNDDEGILPVEVLAPLADRLEELLPVIESEPWPDFQRMTRTFVAGLRDAAAAGEVVRFH
jgi:hypothetical protein